MFQNICLIFKSFIIWYYQIKMVSLVDLLFQIWAENLSASLPYSGIRPVQWLHWQSIKSPVLPPDDIGVTEASQTVDEEVFVPARSPGTDWPFRIDPICNSLYALCSELWR